MSPLPMQLRPKNNRRGIKTSMINDASRSQTSGVTKTKSSVKSRSTSAYDANFVQIMTDNFIDINVDPTPPTNWEDWSERIAVARTELDSFTTNDYNMWTREVRRAKSEAQVMSMVFPTVINGANQAYPYDMDRRCTNWAPLVREDIVDAKPDYFQGHWPGPENADIRRILDEYIVPVPDAPFSPNFFVEGKPETGSLAVGKRQACYDGALGARAIHKLQMLAENQDEEVYDGKAYTVSGILHQGKLEIYLHHLSQPNGPGTEVHYHMTYLDDWNLGGTIQKFRAGTTALRNATDVAFEFRDKFVKAANHTLALAQVSEEGIAADSTRDFLANGQQIPNTTEVHREEAVRFVPTELQQQKS